MPVGIVIRRPGPQTLQSGNPGDGGTGIEGAMDGAMDGAVEGATPVTEGVCEVEGLAVPICVGAGVSTLKLGVIEGADIAVGRIDADRNEGCVDGILEGAGVAPVEVGITVGIVVGLVVGVAMG